MPPRRKRGTAPDTKPAINDQQALNQADTTCNFDLLISETGKPRRTTRASTGSLPASTRVKIEPDHSDHEESNADDDDDEPRKRPPTKKARIAREPRFKIKVKRTFAKIKSEEMADSAIRAEPKSERAKAADRSIIKVEADHDQFDIRQDVSASTSASYLTGGPVTLATRLELHSIQMESSQAHPYLQDHAESSCASSSPISKGSQARPSINRSDPKSETGSNMDIPSQKSSFILASTQGDTAGKVKPGAAKSKPKSKITYANPDDHRTGLLRKKCPVATEARAQRVMEQRMFMIHRTGEIDFTEDFKVLGSTGNVYTVKYDHAPTCDCPDYRKGNSPCKHLLFISLKVLHIPRTAPGRTLADPGPVPGSSSTVELHTTWYQKTLTTSELRAIFSNAPRDPGRLAGVSVDERTRKVWGKYHLGEDDGDAAVAKGDGSVVDLSQDEEAVGRPGEKMADGRRLPEVGDDCPICYDELELEGKGLESMVYHLGLDGCGRALHQQCYAMWASREAAVGNQASCVYCRAVWTSGRLGAGGNVGVGGMGEGEGGTGIGYNGGYTNLGALAGMAQVRDTSSYYLGPRKGMKYRPELYYRDG